MSKLYTLLLVAGIGSAYASPNNTAGNNAPNPAGTPAEKVVKVTPPGELEYYSSNRESVRPFYPDINTGHKFNAVTYGKDKFVAVGESGVIATSNDGPHWTLQNSNTTANLGTISYSATNGYTVRGFDGSKVTSTNGINWMAQNVPAAVITEQAVTQNDGEITSGAYINLNSGVGFLSNLPTGEFNLTANAGYNFNRGFALEGGYALFTGSQGNATVNSSIFDIAVKGTLHMGDVFALYGRAGVGYGLNSWSGTANGGVLNNPALAEDYGLGLVGVGASFKVSRHLDLRIEDTEYIPFVNTYTGSTNAVTGGIQYNF